MDTERRTGAVTVSWGWRQIRLNAMALLFVLATLAGVRAFASNDPVERTFTEPRAEVEHAVSAAKASSSGKLPALEGFVGQTQRPVERYEKAYYQCIFQIIPSVSGEVSVRVTAKITAWYDDPDKQRSGYEVLPSNGRLENDALDRVEEILEGPDAAGTNADKQAPKKYNLSLGPIIPRGSGAVGPSSVKEPRPAPIKTISSPVNEEEIQELRKKRVAAEKRVQQLNNALQNLQELYESQTRPANLVAIKKAGTPVYSHPQERGKPLFAAAARDQFEMIEMKDEWIHVSISGESRGWVRKSQVEFPEDSPASGESWTYTVAKSTALFRMAREEVATFPGGWEALRGKSVKIYSVQPAQSATSETSAREKREFVRELFVRAWKEQSSPDASSIDGVVVILDSVDGGQASVTLASLKQWQDGKISESALWESCSLDPPETFSTTGKK